MFGNAEFKPEVNNTRREAEDFQLHFSSAESSII